jgi:hypothetical protein
VTQQHEIPTHLNVEDTVVLGLSIRQFAYLVVGLAGGYGLWNQWPDLVLGLRVVPAGMWLIAAVTIALVRPYGRGLEEWAFVALHFAVLPKQTVWRVPESERQMAVDASDGWAELVPELNWGETE